MRTSPIYGHYTAGSSHHRNLATAASQGLLSVGVDGYGEVLVTGVVAKGVRLLVGRKIAGKH